jgi:hypothetical protein
VLRTSVPLRAYFDQQQASADVVAKHEARGESFASRIGHVLSPTVLLPMRRLETQATVVSVLVRGGLPPARTVCRPWSARRQSGSRNHLLHLGKHSTIVD